jgi:hypothetical protein
MTKRIAAGVSRRLGVAATIFVATCTAASVKSQELQHEPSEPAAEDASESPVRLIDRAPFDRVTLDAANGNAVIETVLLDFPNRKVPDPLPQDGTLALRRLSQPSIPYAVDWSAIERVELYEHMLQAEAERLTAAGEFGEAFEYFAYLQTNYPDLSGLEDALQAYLWNDASAAFAAGNEDDAWPALVALYQRNTQYPRLADAVQAVSDGLISRRLEEKDYAAARAALELVERHFPQLELVNIPRWRERFQSDAQAQLKVAQAALTAGDYAAAREAAMHADALLPVQGAVRELLRQIQTAAPEIRVGVTQAGGFVSVSKTATWADARVAGLIDPQLVEMTAFGAEGGEYACRFGELGADDAGLETTVRLSTESLRRGVTPDALALRMVKLASTHAVEGRDELAGLLASVRVADGREVKIAWHRPHLHPEAFLQLPLRQLTDASRSPGLWFEAKRRPGDVEIRYQRTGPAEAAAGAPCNVIERIFADDDEAIVALARGEVDVVDRVPPWQLERQRQRPDIVISRYRLPTIHVLVPNPDCLLTRLREFRRALCYGIDRDGIVADLLLGGDSAPGFRSLTGPFPAGTSRNDPVGYGYNADLPQRPYEPRLAALLANVARATLAKRDAESKRKSAPPAEQQAENSAKSDPAMGEDELPPPAPLVLAHPADPLARVACQTIKLQLDRVGIPIELVEFPADQAKAAVEYDLLYAELVVREPLMDARQLLAAEGVAGRASALLTSALDDLDRAQNWNVARTRLQEIHRIAHYDLPLIPLWQTVNYFAHRKWLSGVGDEPVTLYQNLAAWRKEF